MGSNEGVGSRQVVSHDDLSVRVQYNSGGNYMSSPIVRGQTYHTVEYSNLTPVLRTIHAITSVNGGGSSGTFSGTKLKLQFNNGQTWLIYSSSSITWTVSGSRVAASGPFNGAVRAAMMMDASQESAYDQFSGTYPVSGSMSYSVSNNVATINFNFVKRGTGQIMIFALPHHQDILTNANYVSPQIRYRSLKGYMVANIGDTWVMREPLVTDIGFMSRYTVPSGNVAALRNRLILDQNSIPAPTDPYFGGKAVARLGRLAVIADELGETAIAQKIRQNMKNYMQKWFNVGWVPGDNKLVYERSYGGLVSLRSVGSDQADFGQYYYNDHHFHYGYFVYAAACIIKKDVAWGQTYRQKILEIVRDFANPSNSDPAFTKYRNKDWFVGHSYAAGLFAFGDSRNQESTSEAINAYYGVYTLGLALNDPDIRDIGRVLLQTEIRSTRKYWQITNANPIYDAPFSNNKVVGVLWETKTDYATFFGGNVEFIHGIQMLPYTPISEDYVVPEWIRESYPVFSSAYTRSPAPSQGWLGILYQAQATIDKAGAAARINTLTGVDDGNTMTNTLYWLYTRPDGTNQKRSNPFADIDALGNAPAPAPTPPSPSPSPTPSPAPSPPPSPPPSGVCMSCGAGTQACGTVCYSTSNYDCCTGNVIASKGTCSTAPAPSPSPTPSPSPSTDAACTNVRCASGYSCCGGACYSPTVYDCINGRLCPKGTLACGTACYNPNVFICCGGSTLKPVGQTC